MRPRTKDAGRLASAYDAAPELGAESAAVEAALAAWRRKAAGILIGASVAVHLPVAIIVVLGLGPPLGPPLKAVTVTAYLILVAAALFRQVGCRTRLLATFFAGYLVTAYTSLAGGRGPYTQVSLVVYPVLLLVLAGARAARVAILASAAILVSTPFLRDLPAVVRTLGTTPAMPADPPAVVWTQAAGLAAFLAAAMIVLDRFRRFLRDSLAAQCRAMAERQRLEREIAAVSDEERRRLGQELHDGVCQQVTAALLRCQGLENRLGRGGTVSGADVAPLSSLLAETVEDAHNVARGLCPLEPGPEALAPALRALVRRTGEMAGVRCEFLAEGDVRVPDPAMAQHLYRIAQEALSNAARHAHAGRIAVELRGSERELTLRIEDDGAGLPPELPAGGMGMRTMAYRAQILGGDLTVTPAPGGGARVLCRVQRAAGAPRAATQPGEQRWIPAT